MEIKFYSKSEEFNNAVNEYREIWDRNGEKIIEAIERVGGLNFKTEEMEAEIYEGVSSSHPLRFRASYSTDVKRATLVHELCHILLSDNEIRFDTSEEVHMKLNPILYKAWTDLYGKDFADKMVEVEVKRGEVYKRVWKEIQK